MKVATYLMIIYFQQTIAAFLWLNFEFNCCNVGLATFVLLIKLMVHLSQRLLCGSTESLECHVYNVRL